MAVAAPRAQLRLGQGKRVDVIVHVDRQTERFRKTSPQWKPGPPGQVVGSEDHVAAVGIDLPRAGDANCRRVYGGCGDHILRQGDESPQDRFCALCGQRGHLAPLLQRIIRRQDPGGQFGPTHIEDEDGGMCVGAHTLRFLVRLSSIAYQHLSSVVRRRSSFRQQLPRRGQTVGHADGEWILSAFVFQ